jgi:hypothetical protein
MAVPTLEELTRYRWSSGAARATDPMFYRKLADAKKHSPLVR